MSLIALLGGTFDPIHFGHLRAALEIVEAMQADRIHLIPTALPAHRGEPRASFAERFEMLKSAIGGDPKMRADDREWLRYQRTQEASFTIDTVREMRAEVGPKTPLAWIIGSDQLAKLDTWKEWQRLLDFVHLVVVKRPESERVPAHVDAFLTPSRAPKSRMRDQPAGCFCALDISQLAISASKIRELIRTDKDPRFLLPEKVIERISAQALYRS